MLWAPANLSSDTSLSWKVPHSLSIRPLPCGEFEYGVDAQLSQQATELGRLPSTRQLLLQGFFVLGWCLEDAVAVPVDGQGYTVSGYNVFHQLEIALRILF